MNLYELYQQSPEQFWLVLVVSIVLTILVYGAFPIIFAKTRKKYIAQKKYRRLCYSINAIGMLFFIIVNGASSGGPYLLWTWIFSRRGAKILEAKGMFNEANKEIIKKEQGCDNLSDDELTSEEKQKDNAELQEQITIETSKNIPEETKGLFKVQSCETVDNADEIRYSLSTEGETFRTNGDYSVCGADVALDSTETIQKKRVAVISSCQDQPKKKSGSVVKRRVRYCSHCGNMVDSDTKKCVGCGKQYFKWPKSRLNKFSGTIVILASVVVAVSGVCVWQFVNTQSLKGDIATLERDLGHKRATISRLEGQIDDLEDEKWDNWSKLYFFDTYAEIIPNDGTNTYHKWGCSKLDEDASFWIYNTEAVKGDYYKCPKCH